MNKTIKATITVNNDQGEIIKKFQAMDFQLKTATFANLKKVFTEAFDHEYKSLEEQGCKLKEIRENYFRQ